MHLQYLSFIVCNETPLYLWRLHQIKYYWSVFRFFSVGVCFQHNFLIGALFTSNEIVVKHKHALKRTIWLGHNVLDNIHIVFPQILYMRSTMSENCFLQIPCDKLIIYMHSIQLVAKAFINTNNK